MDLYKQKEELQLNKTLFKENINIYYEDLDDFECFLTFFFRNFDSDPNYFRNFFSLDYANRSLTSMTKFYLPIFMNNLVLSEENQIVFIDVLCLIDIDNDIHILIQKAFTTFLYDSQYLSIKLMGILASLDDYEAFINYGEFFLESDCSDIDLLTDLFSITSCFIAKLPFTYIKYINNVKLFEKITNFISDGNKIEQIDGESMSLAFEVLLTISTTDILDPIGFLNDVVSIIQKESYELPYIVQLQAVSILGNIYNKVNNDGLFFNEGVVDMMNHYIECPTIELLNIIAPLCVHFMQYNINNRVEIPSDILELFYVLDDALEYIPENLVKIHDLLDKTLPSDD